MKYSKENFCALFTRAQQIARKEGLDLDNTPLNKDFCPFAQACLGVNCLLIKLLTNNPPRKRINLSQKNSSFPIDPKNRFMGRLEKTAQILGIDY